MDSRGRKRAEAADLLPTDKRACSSSEFRSSPPPPSLPPPPPPPPPSEDEYVNSDVDVVDDDDEDNVEEEEDEYEDNLPEGPNGENINRDIRRRIDGVIAGLASGETDVVIAALSELIDMLLYATVYTIHHMVPKLHSIMQALVDAVGGDGSAELLLESARAVFYLCDMIPGSVPVLLRHEGLPVLCRRLLAPEYLDVGEQCVKVLEKVSQSKPVQCLEAGAVMACLAYLDFFPINVQKTTLSTVANMCKKLSPSHAPHVVDAVPILSGILQYDNDKLVEKAASCLRRIVESFSDLPEKLIQIHSVDLISQCVDLIASKRWKSLGRTFTDDVLSVLSQFASNSPEVVKMLLGLNISATLRDILTSLVPSGSGASRSLLTSGHYDQALEIFKLLHQLLPPVAICDEKNQQSLAKEQIFLDNPHLLHQFAQNIIPLLIQVVDSVTSSFIRYVCLSIIKSIVYFSTPEELLDLLNKTCISSSLANLLSDKDDHVLVSSLRIADILLQRYPDTFLQQFVKEGLAYAIDLLLKLNGACDMADQPLDTGCSSFSNSQIAENSVSGCYCYSFDLSRSPPPQTRRCKSGKVILFNLAKNIKCSYFASPGNGNINPDQALSMLTTFCSVLNDNVKKFSEIDYNVENEEYLAHVLDRILFEVKVEDMSTFEFIESGIVKSIINYLCDGQYFQREMLCPDFQCRSHVVMQRCQTFARMMSSQYCSQREDLMLAVLVRKLQSSLISLCKLPVITSQPFKSRDGVYVDIPYGRTTLHPCFKVKFAKDEADNVLRDCSARVIKVEPSSSFSSIEKYLWPNIAPNKTATGFVGKGMSELVDDLNVSQLIVNEGSVPGSRRFGCLEPSVKQETPISLTQKLSDLRPGKVGKFTDPQKETSAESKMIFYLNDKEIDKSLTIYQAIIQQKANLQSDLILNDMFWNQVYTITYKTSVTANPKDIHPSELAADNEFQSFWVKLPFFSSLLSAKLPFQLERENPFYDILFLLRTLEGVNKYASMLLSNKGLHDFSDQLVISLLIPESELLSSKLSEKLEQQMADNFSLLTGNMPAWFSCLVALCPFMFSFEIRSTFFRVAQLAFQRTNQIQRTSQETNTDSLSVPRSSHLRRKFVVDRNHILESAEKIMELNASIEVTLDVEYDDEIGTGIGPTMEFYTLASREFQKCGLNLWRGDHYPSTVPVGPIAGELVDVKYVDASMGLFPRPWSTIPNFLNENQFSDVLLKFKLLGWLVARAMYDERILDLPLSKAFYKLILGQELGIYDISSFDPELGRTLLEFQSLACRKRYLEESSSGNCEIHFRDARIEDLYIDFTLPGYADYVFSTEDSKMVSSANLEEYIFLVVDATVRSGISKQMEAFESGFNEVFPMRSLSIFSEEELEQMLCGEQDTWTFEELLDNIKFDHGYTVRSSQVVDFLEIIIGFKCHERRAFLQFVTGAPRLPLGGLAALIPKLTVVRKHVNGCADMDLPSVMTCANYLKLPPYSSKEKTRERLLYAITEGQGSFHLS